jgi:sugar phosphate isomerase/epimerase
MKFSIASYSFHRLLREGKQDIFKYIQDCKDFGAAQLDAWNGHLAVIEAEDKQLRSAHDPNSGQPAGFSAPSDTYLQQVKNAADAVGLPFGCIAVDGPAIYDPDPAVRDTYRQSVDRWLTVVQTLGGKQMRIDASRGNVEYELLPDDVMQAIIDGYRDLIPRAREKGIEILIENHWRPTQVPENLKPLLDNVDGLGLLLDTNNWVPERREECWEIFAPYARSVHIKTFAFDENGIDPTMNLEKAIQLLLDAGYNDVWGIESGPKDGDEYGAVEKTIALIRRVVEG